MATNQMITDQRTKIAMLENCSQWMRVRCAQAISEAGSGHPSTCFSAADIVAAIFFESMRYDPAKPDHPGNDRFVLSKGHAAPLLYAAWSLAGVVKPESLMNLRRLTSNLEGHPTPRFSHAEGATGSLGQGLSIATGMALAGKKLDAAPYRVFCLMGDGELMEGSVWEAAALASHNKLDNLIAFADINRLGQSQATSLGHDLETYKDRFSAFGWDTKIIDGHDMGQILEALATATKSDGRPFVIVAKTLKGKGVSFIEDKNGWHGKPFKKGEELDRAIKELGGLPVISIPVPMRLPSSLLPPLKKGDGEGFTPVSAPNPPTYRIGDQIATREAYGPALVKLGQNDPNVVALDGDTKNSTFAEVFMKAFPERFFEGFIAEQNLVGMALGLSLRGKKPFLSTFGAFFARAYDQIRMAAISQANIKLMGSHAGVSIGEDGPSQMALEDLAMMRTIPNSVVLYPADAVAMEKLVFEAAHHQGIVYIRGGRPKNPVIYYADEKFPIGGCKTVRKSAKDKITVVAAGITLFEALKSHDLLAQEAIFIRIIDAYSVKPLDVETLKKSAGETNNQILVVEDHYPQGGLGDAVAGELAPLGVKVHKIAVNQIPRSGSPQELLDLCGISSRFITDAIRNICR